MLSFIKANRLKVWEIFCMSSIHNSYIVGTKLPQKSASRPLLPPQLQALAALDMPSVCSHVPRGILLTKDLAPIDPLYVHWKNSWTTLIAIVDMISRNVITNLCIRLKYPLCLTKAQSQGGVTSRQLSLLKVSRFIFISKDPQVRTLPLGLFVTESLTLLFTFPNKLIHLLGHSTSTYSTF